MINNCPTIIINQENFCRKVSVVGTCLVQVFDASLSPPTLCVGGVQRRIRHGLPNPPAGLEKMVHTDMDDNDPLPCVSVCCRLLPASKVDFFCCTSIYLFFFHHSHYHCLPSPPPLFTIITSITTNYHHHHHTITTIYVSSAGLCAGTSLREWVLPQRGGQT